MSKHADYYKFVASLSDAQKAFLAHYVHLNPVRFLREVMNALKQTSPSKSPEPWGTDEYRDAEHPFAIIKYRKTGSAAEIAGEYQCYLNCACGQPNDFVAQQLGIDCPHCGAVYMASGGIGLLLVGRVPKGEDFPDSVRTATNENAATARAAAVGEGEKAR